MYHLESGEKMYLGNIRFLIIITLMFIPAIVIFIWNCRSKGKYQKMLEKGGE